MESPKSFNYTLNLNKKNGFPELMLQRDSKIVYIVQKQSLPWRELLDLPTLQIDGHREGTEEPARCGVSTHGPSILFCSVKCLNRRDRVRRNWQGLC